MSGIASGPLFGQQHRHINFSFVLRQITGQTACKYVDGLMILVGYGFAKLDTVRMYNTESQHGEEEKKAKHLDSHAKEQ